jgi:hypothetical protein
MDTVIVPVNYGAVLLAAIASMVVGALWYGPLLGKPWMKEMGLTKDKIEKEKKKGMSQAYGLMFLGSLVMAYVLSHTTAFASAYMGIEGVPVGLSTGFWNWLGFVAPVTLGSVLWEGKSWKLWLINNGYYLITMPLMGAIIMGMQ